MRAIPPHREHEPLQWPEEGGPRPEPEPYRGPSAWRATRRGLRLAYDSPAVTLLGSLLWTVLVATVGSGILLAPALGPALWVTALVLAAPLLALAQAAVQGAAACVVTHRSQGPLDLVWAAGRLFWRSLAATALWAALTGVGLVAMGFYLARGGFGWVLLAAVVLYLLLLVQAVFCFVWPFLAQQEVGLRLALRRSLLVVLDNPLFTAGVLLAQGVVWGLAALGMPLLVGGLGAVSGVFVLWLLFGAAGTAATLSNQALAEVMRKYEEAG